MSTVQRTITDIIDTEYKAFAMYTLEARAIPSVVDGLKPVQRKIVYAMLTDYPGKKVKISDISGISKFNYHHGESSAAGAAINMGSAWMNNVPILEGHGNFGSRLVQEAAAPRYIYASLSKVFQKVFIDEEVAPKAFDEENPEPAFYLPIVPWVLINGIDGLSVGFRTAILPRSIVDVSLAVAKYIKNPEKFLKDDAPIPPTFPSFTGEVIPVNEKSWKTRGKISYIGKNYFEITELPIGYDREKYIILLNEMVDKDLIRDYDDNCSKDGFGFKIKVSLAQKDAIEKDPFKYFSLERSHSEILTTLGIDGKLKIFESVAQLIAYFVDYRLIKFRDKIDYDIRKKEDESNFLKDKIKFIRAVIQNRIDFRKTTKQELIDIQNQITENEYGKKFLNIPLYECTSDAVETLNERLEEASIELVRLKKLDEKNIFLESLNGLKKVL